MTLSAKHDSTYLAMTKHEPRQGNELSGFNFVGILRWIYSLGKIMVAEVTAWLLLQSVTFDLKLHKIPGSPRQEETQAESSTQIKSVAIFPLTALEPGFCSTSQHHLVGV